MAIRNVTPPPRTRVRKPAHTFSDKEVKQAIDMLQSGGNPAVGPYDKGDDKKSLRAARAAVASLLREVQKVDGDLDIGTRAWMEDDGAIGALRLR